MAPPTLSRAAKKSLKASARNPQMAAVGDRLALPCVQKQLATSR